MEVVTAHRWSQTSRAGHVTSVSGTFTLHPSAAGNQDADDDGVQTV